MFQLHQFVSNMYTWFVTWPAKRCDLIFTALHRSFQVLHLQGMSRIENLEGSYLLARPFAWWQTKSDVVLASKMKK